MFTLWLPPKVWLHGSQSTITGRSVRRNGQACRIICWLAASIRWVDRKSTRLNSSHSQISYAVFCLKKKKHHAWAPLGVVSCKRRALIKAELEATGLREFFDVFIDFNEFTPTKTEPDPLLSALHYLS